MASGLSRSQLLEIYKISVEEYRFQVKLNWDRTRYYLVLTGALLSIAATLLRQSELTDTGTVLVGGIFLMGMLAATVGIKTVSKGHEYYERTVYKKTLLEDTLGFTRPLRKYRGNPMASLGIASTAGMSNSQRMLRQTEAWLSEASHLKRGSIGWWIQLTLGTLFALNYFGLAFLAVYVFDLSPFAWIAIVWAFVIIVAKAATEIGLSDAAPHEKDGTP